MDTTTKVRSFLSFELVSCFRTCDSRTGRGKVVAHTKCDLWDEMVRYFSCQRGTNTSPPQTFDSYVSARRMYNLSPCS
jgi:hypothetical protein